DRDRAHVRSTLRGAWAQVASAQRASRHRPDGAARKVPPRFWKFEWFCLLVFGITGFITAQDLAITRSQLLFRLALLAVSGLGLLGTWIARMVLKRSEPASGPDRAEGDAP